MDRRQTSCGRGRRPKAGWRPLAHGWTEGPWFARRSTSRPRHGGRDARGPPNRESRARRPASTSRSRHGSRDARGPPSPPDAEGRSSGDGIPGVSSPSHGSRPFKPLKPSGSPVHFPILHSGRGGRDLRVEAPHEASGRGDPRFSPLQAAVPDPLGLRPRCGSRRAGWNRASMATPSPFRQCVTADPTELERSGRGRRIEVGVAPGSRVLRGPWCNGSTLGFGPRCPSSNLGGPVLTESIDRRFVP